MESFDVLSVLSLVCYQLLKVGLAHVDVIGSLFAGEDGVKFLFDFFIVLSYKLQISLVSETSVLISDFALVQNHHVFVVLVVFLLEFSLKLSQIGFKGELGFLSLFTLLVSFEEVLFDLALILMLVLV